LTAMALSLCMVPIMMMHIDAITIIYPLRLITVPERTACDFDRVDHLL